MADKDRPDCKTCLEMKRRAGLEPPCDTCRPKLLPENNIVLYLSNRYGAMFSNETGINADGIRLALDIEKIPDKDRPLIVHKLIVYTVSTLNKSMEKMNG